jgi:thiamine-phosphate pyrophosphorylase
MRLIVITPENNITGEHQIVNALLERGLFRIHVRKPAFDTAAYREYLQNIDPAHWAKVTVHGGFELYGELSLGGIHLNVAARQDAKIAKLIQPPESRAISASLHSWQEVEELNTLYHYVFISPLFDSISKKGYLAATPVQEIHDLRKKAAISGANLPLIIGLGGVCRTNIGELKENGYDGAALLGAIWNAKDPLAEYDNIASLIK